MYLERLKDEAYFFALAQKISNYISRHEELQGLTKLTLRVIEHYYYKTQDVYDSMKNLVLLRQQEKEKEEKDDDGDDGDGEEKANQEKIKNEIEKGRINQCN